MHRRLAHRTFATAALLWWAAGIGVQAYGPAVAAPVEPVEDPSVRILTGHAPLPLQFTLLSRDGEPTAWQAPRALRPAPWLDTPETAAPTPALRLWMPLSVAARSVHFTQAYLHLSGSAGQHPGDALQWRPGAGVVMHFGEAPGMLQQMSLGSVLRLDMGQGSQVSLRLKGGRLGVQYRLQFSP
jgi:hypothetical protein